MTKIKICGITTVKDALAAMEAGADLIGFNFYPKSPRYVEVGMCRNIMAVMRRYGRVTCVGVFVNASIAEICATMDTLGLNLAQLHGDETPQMLKMLKGKAFKAIRLSTSESVEESVYPFLASVGTSVHPLAEQSVDPFLTSVSESVHPFAEQSVDPFPTSVSESVHPLAEQSVDKPVLLVDAAVKGLYGGSGVTADWKTAAQLANKYPLLLAGGLTPENVADAVRQVKPWGVDVASGVESAPGEKDARKMIEFVKSVRGVEKSRIALPNLQSP